VTQIENTTHKKAFVYRLYPTRAQEAALVRILDLTRELYNAALQERRAALRSKHREAWRKAGKSLTVYDQMRLLGEVKAVRPEYREVYAQVLQETLKQLDRAFQGFFQRVKQEKKPGFPRFRGRGWWDSFTFPQVTRQGHWVGPGKLLGNGKVKVPGVGHVRIKQHRPLEGVPKTFTLKRQAGNWYAVYTCEVPHQPLPPSQEAVGIDLGLIHFASTSDGETFAPPKAHQKAEARLKRTQKALSKKQRCSNRYRKLQKQLARYLVNRYGTIAHEDLNLAGLHRTRLAKSFSDADHAQFISILLVFAARSNSAKAASAGRLLCEANTERVIAVRPHGTSQTCPNCGSVRKKELSERIHVCECGCVLDRDVAAAKVILALGLDGALGDGQRVAAPI